MYRKKLQFSKFDSSEIDKFIFQLGTFKLVPELRVYSIPIDVTVSVYMIGLTHGVACLTELTSAIFAALFCYNFASETPTEFIFSQLVDLANVTLSNA